MSEELDATASLAYEAYRQAHMGTVAGGLPMPVFEQLSVPERDAWLAVAGAVTIPAPPELLTRQEEPAPPTPAAGPPAVRWTQANLEQMTVVELRELVHAEHLIVPASATKPQLIDELLAAQAARPTERREQ